MPMPRKPPAKAAPARAKRAGSTSDRTAKGAKPRAATPAPAKARKRPAPRAALPMPAAPAIPLAKRQADACTPVEELFLAEYMKDLHGTQAYIRAVPGTKPDVARTMAARLLGKNRVASRLAELRAAQMQRLELEADDVVREARDVAFADMRELVEYRVDCCRYCFGTDNRYQRTAGEMARARTRHEEIEDAREARAEARGRQYVRRPFDEQGGIGFDALKRPNPDCPECFGRGMGRVIIKDTANLSREARALYAGVKETKDGLEVKAHSKLDALEKLFRHLGLYEADNRQKPPAVLIDAASLDDLYQQARAHAEQQRLEMKERAKRLAALDSQPHGLPGG